MVITNKDTIKETDYALDLSNDVDVEEFDFVDDFDKVLGEDDDFSETEVDFDIFTSTNSNYFINELFSMDLIDKVSLNAVGDLLEIEDKNEDDDSFTLDDILPPVKIGDKQHFY